MDLSSIPTKIDIIWAQDAGGTYVRTVPDTVQQPTYPYAASWPTGFPPNTFLSPVAGGEGPDGRDMNGGLQAVSAWSRWQAAGGPIIYDASFQTNISGYPNRAIVGSATTPGNLWVSTADGNVTNPDTGGAGWADFFAPVYAKCPLKNGSGATGTWAIGISGNAATASNSSQLNGQAGSYYTSYAAAVAATAQTNSEAYAAALLAAAFSSQTLSGKGHIFINGLILNWNTLTVGGAGTVDNFDYPFPNAVFGVIGTDNGSGSHAVSAVPANTSQVALSSSAYPTATFYVAVGH